MWLMVNPYPDDRLGGCVVFCAIRVDVVKRWVFGRQNYYFFWHSATRSKKRLLIAADVKLCRWREPVVRATCT